MRFRPFAVPLAVTVWSAGACTGASDLAFDPALGLPPGEYEYAASDMNGTLLLQGRLTLTLEPDGMIAGTWDITWAPGADTTTVVGPQVGSGELRGGGNNGGGQIYVDMNPGWADNNVFLVGTSGPDGVSGEWSYSTFIGPVANGSFVARRR